MKCVEFYFDNESRVQAQGNRVVEMMKMGSFRSYVGLEEYEMKVPQSGNGAILQPCFLSGELVVAEAHNVLKFTSLSKKKGLSGSLFVTNARLVFVSSDHVCTEDSVPLLSIHSLCHYEEPKGSSASSGGKLSKRRVKLGPNNPASPHNSGSSSSLFCSGSTRIYELLVICSNFRTLRVSFKFSRMDHGQKICNALIHFSFPQQVEKLFYLDYVRNLEWTSKSGNSIPLYTVAGDWLREIKISRTTGFRITTANVSFDICQSLPESFVIPASLTDVRLTSLAEKLRGSRPPFWVWGDFRGSAILRMSKLNNEADSSAENAFYETLRKYHPSKRQPRIYDLDLNLPVKDIRISMNRLIDLCCPETFTQFQEADSHFLSLLENSKWMLWISKVLHISSDIAKGINASGDVVILQENESRDVSCLISSVTQTIIDARFRTVFGFFTLIQKEWIVMGHPFHSGYTHSSPIFLLFLDCVFQLLRQNPFEFEFNEQLLNDIWDSCFDSTTGTFLFDTPCQRKDMESRKDLNMWNTILNKENSNRDQGVDEQEGFSTNYPQTTIPTSLLNPMYKLKPLLYPPPVEGFRKSCAAPVLAVAYTMCDLQLWNSLYLGRTLETVPIINSGSVSSSPTNVSQHRLSSPLPFTRNYNINPKSMNNSSSTFAMSPGSTANTASSPQKGKSSSSCFLFSSNNNEMVNPSGSIALSGRDPTVEMKLVDTLLVALSSSTRYSKNPSQSTGGPPTNSGVRVGLGLGPSVSRGVSRSIGSPSVTQQHQIFSSSSITQVRPSSSSSRRQRQNPFADIRE